MTKQMVRVRYEVCVNGTLDDIIGFASLKPCPFCGGDKLELANTHTASCWVECLDCRGNAHGKAFYKGKRQSRKCFYQAIKSAAQVWNRRA